MDKISGLTSDIFLSKRDRSRKRKEIFYIKNKNEIRFVKYIYVGLLIFEINYSILFNQNLEILKFVFK